MFRGGYLIHLSPRSNSNLLQRSEVVALMNTLHRFSESLDAVDDFRRIWAKTSSTDSEKLIVEAENTIGRVSVSGVLGNPASDCLDSRDHRLPSSRLHQTMLSRSLDSDSNPYYECARRALWTA